MTRFHTCVLAVAMGCVTQLPGEPIGTYRVRMALVENTCGPRAVIETDGYRFSVELRGDGQRAFWRLADRRPVQGTEKDGQYRFSWSGLAASEPDAGTTGCQIMQDDLIEVRLVEEGAREGGAMDAGGVPGGDAGGVPGGDAGGVPGGDAGGVPGGDAGLAVGDAGVPAGIVGTHVFRMTARDGTDCSRALLAGGGPFEALPCTVRYRLEGSARERF